MTTLPLIDVIITQDMVHYKHEMSSTNKVRIYKSLVGGIRIADPWVDAWFVDIPGETHIKRTAWLTYDDALKAIGGARYVLQSYVGRGYKFNELLSFHYHYLCGSIIYRFKAGAICSGCGMDEDSPPRIETK